MLISKLDLCMATRQIHWMQLIIFGIFSDGMYLKCPDIPLCFPSFNVDAFSRVFPESSGVTCGGEGLGCGSTALAHAIPTAAYVINSKVLVT